MTLTTTTTSAAAAAQPASRRRIDMVGAKFCIMRRAEQAEIRALALNVARIAFEHDGRRTRWAEAPIFVIRVIEIITPQAARITLDAWDF